MRLGRERVETFFVPRRRFNPPPFSVAARGGDVVLACRDAGRAAAASNRVKAAAAARRAGGSRDVGAVSTAPLDLTRTPSAAALGTALARGRLPTAIVCNAGIMTPAIPFTTGEGFDGQWAANYLGHHTLVASFFNARLAKRAPSNTRIVWLSSVTHRGGRLSTPALLAAAAAPTPAAARALAPRRPGFGGYADAKLACTLAAADWQRRFGKAGTDDVAVSVHPGLVDTALARGWLTGPDLLGPLAPVLGPPLAKVAGILLKPVDVAVADVLFALTAPPAIVAGRHTAGGRVVTPSPAARDEALATALTAAAGAWTGVKACLG